jgi:hypothetical protein
MPYSQLPLADGEGALQQRLGLFVFALSVVEACQVVEAVGRVWVLWSHRLFSNCQGALEQRLGLLVLPLVGVEACQVVETAGRICKGPLRSSSTDGQPSKTSEIVQESSTALQHISFDTHWECAY